MVQSLRPKEAFLSGNIFQGLRDISQEMLMGQGKQEFVEIC